MLDVFSLDEKYEENEGMWAAIRGEILGENSGSENDATDDDAPQGEGDEGDSDEEGEGEGPPGGGGDTVLIRDLTEQDLVNLRRTIYLTIMSSAGFEECCHKLMKLNIQEGYEVRKRSAATATATTYTTVYGCTSILQLYSLYCSQWASL